MYPLDAILLGAGSGTRYTPADEQRSNQIPKQFHLIEGKPVFIWALEALMEEASLRRVVIVVPNNQEALARNLLGQYFNKPETLEIHFVLGGKRRQDSSQNAVNYLKKLKPWPKTVLIHDACRPFLGNTLKNGLANIAQKIEFTGAIPGIPITETVKTISDSNVVATLDRTSLIRVQTPQIFNFSLLVKLFDQIEFNPNIQFTDDASLLEYFGETVSVFSGDERNVKLTYEVESYVVGQHLKTKRRNSSCESEPATTFTA